MPARPLSLAEAHLAAMIPAESDLGPAMRALTDRQRVFVVALLNMGSKLDQSRAAKMAGYLGNQAVLKVSGHRLAHSPKVQAAILEEAKKRMQLGTAAATALMIETIGDKTVAHKDRLRAAEGVLDRGGIHHMTEHRIEVNHNDTRTEKILRVVQLARQLGKDPRELLGNLADAMEGDFKVLEEETSPSATAEGNV